MSRRSTTIAPAYFDALYRTADDPWGFQTSEYERDKYAATLDMLSRPTYREALEVGCSIGVFTARLADRCDRVLAIDASEVALASARSTCQRGHVRFEARMVPEGFPSGQFDLIVLSEVLYYLDAPDLRRVADHCAAALTADGEIVTCHWLGETDYPLTGAEASELFAEAMLTRLPVRTVAPDRPYRLQRLSSG